MKAFKFFTQLNRARAALDRTLNSPGSNSEEAAEALDKLIEVAQERSLPHVRV
ncbi:hypothetical protein PJK54_11700 [Cobetia sp. MMG027]|uniref:hypothetical protein n=1 Tax=Cobetia sp. MMG027 TaxID=3021980 RepID=UPI0022FE6128|nr:hypothetical protein [Cobetia sp. MMG027]MDA5564327.1 hypothetical protein [Cobetia sp. MMG027]